MTHEALMRFEKYRKGTAESKNLALAITGHVTDAHALEPIETKNGYLQYPTNFLLIETIHQSKESVTIDVFGPKSAYSYLDGPAVRVTDGQNGQTKLYVTSSVGLPSALTAIDRSWSRRNGTPVARKAGDGTPASASSNVGMDWSEAECAATVADYFDMLAADLLRQDYSKAAHNRTLQQTVDRSSGSIEFKHANISAVLVEMQQPYIEGYKPRGNFQRRLADSVAVYLDQHPDFFLRPEILAAIEPTERTAAMPASLLGIFEEPPELIKALPDSTPWLSRRGRRVNFAERDARNRQLGRLGEQFALEVERLSLINAGRADLADRVEWIAETCGDGVGYDVLSFDAITEAEKWLEVKTTSLPKYHPFLVTANEVRCSEAEPERFHLFRVFDYRTSPKAFVLPGALSSRCELRPSLYTAAPKSS